jgi:hypothetical protein
VVFAERRRWFHRVAGRQNAPDAIPDEPGTIVEPMQSGRFAGGLKFVSPDVIGLLFAPDGMFEYFERMST